MKKRFSLFLRVLGVLMLVLIVAFIVAAVIGINFLMKQSEIPQNSILEISFQDNIPEKSTSLNFFNKFIEKQEEPVSLREVSELLDKAKDDKKIRAILIKGESLLSHTKAVELQNALLNFKDKSDKPLYAYGSFYSQGAYLAASVADTITLHPQGGIDLKGYAIIFTYFKDFLNRYDLDMEVFRAGKYKSYIESYTRNDASDESVLQFTQILDGFQQELIDKLAHNTGVDIEQIGEIIMKNGAARAKDCMAENLIDKIAYETDFREMLLKRYNEEKSGFISLGQYKNHISCRGKNSSPKVAYLAMSGNIGETTGEISSSYLRETFKTIRKDKDIKTILLRIDSGGGSAFASEDIWHEIELCKKAGVEIITSISTMAGSGGYYIIANSDKIFANKNSIVGSIGVFIAFPVVKNALEKHVGVHFDEIKTGPFAARIKGINNLTPEQKEYYSESTEELYSLFKERVASGRKLDVSFVDSIAQGRIYTGDVAMELGLVDSLIDLQQSIAYIQNKYKGKSVEFIEFPTSEEDYFGKFEISDLLQVVGGNQSQWEKVATESVHEFSHMITHPTPQARVDFFQFVK